VGDYDDVLGHFRLAKVLGGFDFAQPDVSIDELRDRQERMAALADLIDKMSELADALRRRAAPLAPDSPKPA
jgi:hypothetical protein